MKYSYVLLVMFFSLLELNAQSFLKVNNIKNDSFTNTIKCDNPTTAITGMKTNIAYGCFCGKDYSKTINTNYTAHKNLNKQEQIKLISAFNARESYDNIDEACKQNELCKIKKGTNSYICKEIMYTTLIKIKNKFNNVSRKQCHALTSDMALSYTNIFTKENRNDFMDFGIAIMNTPIIVANNGIQETSSRLNEKSVYPKKGKSCRLRSFRY